MNFFHSEHCGQGENKARCYDCRNDPQFRYNVAQGFADVTDVDFACPHVSTDKRIRKPAVLEADVVVVPQDIQAMGLKEIEAAIAEMDGADRDDGLWHLKRVEDRLKRTTKRQCLQNREVGGLRVWLARKRSKVAA